MKKSIKPIASESGTGQKGVLLPLQQKPEPNNNAGFRLFLQKHGQNDGQKLIFIPYVDYKPARLYPLKAKLADDWYVYYEIYSEEEHTFIPMPKVRVNINRIKDLKDKKIYGANLVKAVDSLLKRGITPDVYQQQPFDKEGNLLDPGEDIRRLPIIAGLKWAFEERSKEVQPNTVKDYRSVLKYVNPAIEKIGYSKITVGQFRKGHLRKVMDLIQKEEGISDNRYNTYVENLQGLYKAFKRNDVFDVSPIAFFERKDEEDPEPTETLTPEERRKVFDYFLKVNPGFLHYFLCLYHTALRPKEIVALQISNYYEAEACFRLHPKETVVVHGKEERKTKGKKRARYIPIPPELYGIMKAKNLSQFPAEWYVFGKGFDPGSVNIARKVATDYWKKHVKGILKIDKDLYSLKYSGIDDKLENKVSRDAIRGQAGHETKQMTEIYGSKVNKMNQQEINEKSKGFLEE